MATPPTVYETDDLPSHIERLDIAAINALKPWFDHPLAKAADGIGSLGDEPPVLKLTLATLAVGGVLRDPRVVRAGLRMLAAHGVAVAIKSIAKKRIDRSRPSHMLDTGRYVMRRGQSKDRALQSFPSGHAAGAIAVARAAARELPEFRLAFIGGAAVIAAVQVPRRSHFPTDVIAGLMVGVVAEAITNVIWRRLIGGR